jgi:ATP-dependent Lon protease
MNKMPENGALRDRIFPIHIPAYTHQQKFQILKNHTIPKMLEQSKLEIVFEDDVINHIVRTAKGDGMRQCIHTVKDIVYKLVFLKNHPDMSVSFKVKLPENNYITMDIIQKLMSTKKEPTYQNMYV